MRRRTSTHRLALAGVLPVSVALVLAGCGGNGGTPADPPADPVPSAPVETPADPEPEPSIPDDDVDAMLPGCDTLISIEDVRTHLGDMAEPMSPIEDLEDVLPGPSANAAVAEASDVVACPWGIPQSDSGFRAVVAVLPAEVANSFVEDLRTDGFNESALDGALVFTGTQPGGLGDVQSAYVIDGTLLSAVIGGTLDESSAVELAGLARDASLADQNSMG